MFTLKPFSNAFGKPEKCVCDRGDACGDKITFSRTLFHFCTFLHKIVAIFYNLACAWPRLKKIALHELFLLFAHFFTNFLLFFTTWFAVWVEENNLPRNFCTFFHVFSGSCVFFTTWFASSGLKKITLRDFFSFSRFYVVFGNQNVYCLSWDQF